MAKGVMMPKQGITVESCILTEWKVKVGDQVKVGDVLFGYETDKSAFEQESEFEGEVLALLCEAGDEVPVLNNVCIIGTKGEDISALTGGSAPAAEPVKEAAPATPVAQAAPAAPVATNAKGVMMPKQGITVESCILTEWKVKVGDKVKKGDVLFGYETDKASFEQESEFEGEVLALLCEAGEEVPVLNNVCVIGEKGDDISCFLNGGAAPAPAVADAPVVAKAEVAAPAQTQATAQTAVVDGDRIFASPRAKKLAEKMGVNLKDATPSGPNGRIVEADIRVASTKPKTAEVVAEAKAEAVAPASTDLKAFADEKMPNIRKVIAKNMMNSLSSMAQLTHTLSFDCTNVMAFRAYLKANAEKLNLPNITINDIIIFAVSRVIKNHKVLNAHLLNGDTMRYFEHVNMGIATDAPKGLLVPVLFGADTMSLSEISANAKKLTKGAQAGTISPELLSGGSFTISNLGTMGIESFTPVINPPQTGILGVNSFETRIKLGKNGEIIPYTAMALSLTYDHRALDGAPASRFLKDLKEYLENFSLNLVVDKKGL